MDDLQGFKDSEKRRTHMDVDGVESRRHIPLTQTDRRIHARLAAVRLLRLQLFLATFWEYEKRKGRQHSWRMEKYRNANVKRTKFDLVVGCARTQRSTNPDDVITLINTFSWLVQTDTAAHTCRQIDKAG